MSLRPRALFSQNGLSDDARESLKDIERILVDADVGYQLDGGHIFVAQPAIQPKKKKKSSDSFVCIQPNSK